MSEVLSQLQKNGYAHQEIQLVNSDFPGRMAVVYTFLSSERQKMSYLPL